MKRQSIFVEIICCAFILLFGYTAVSKLLDMESFIFDIRKNFPFLFNYALAIAIAVPAIELIISIMIIIQPLRKIGLVSAFALMGFFTLYVARILSFSKNIPCTCGGVLREMSWTQHLWFNVFFTLLAGLALFLYARQRRISKKYLAVR